MKFDELGGKILKEVGLCFDAEINYHWLMKSRYVGYAHYYLSKCWNDSKKTNEADVSIYRQLVGIDSNLGILASIQLDLCLSWTTRWNIIKVSLKIKIHIDY